MYYTTLKPMNDVFFISAKNLSAFAARKLAISNGFGFVRQLEKLPFNKVKVAVYYFDIPFINSPADYVSDEIVDISDLRKFDWDAVVDLYRNHSMQFVVRDYLEYIEVFYSKQEYGTVQHSIYMNAGSDEPLITYASWDEYIERSPEWMIQQVENGNINIEAAIAACKERFYKELSLIVKDYED